METIKLDLIPGKKMPSLHASQFDDGRAYHIELTENRVPYVLDGTETISVIVRKCDNTLVSMDIANTFANKSYLEFEVTEQMTACSGFNYGEIILEKNGDRLGSLNFYLVVESAPDENGITSTSEVLNLNRQITEEVDRILPDMVDEVAEPIINEKVPEKVEELVPSAVSEVAEPIVREIAPEIVAEQVPIVMGDNYYNKTQTEEKIGEIINDGSTAENKTWSSAKTSSELSGKASVITKHSDLLFDKPYTDKKFISNSDGSISTNNAFCTFFDISIPENCNKLFPYNNDGSHLYIRSICFFNSSNVFISGVSGTDDSVVNGVVVPSGAKTLACSLRYANTTTLTLGTHYLTPTSNGDVITETLNPAYGVEANSIKGHPITDNIRKACFNFQFDDGNTKDADIKAIFDSFGYKCGFAILSNADATTRNRYLEFQNAGYEILCHADNGTAMNDPTVPPETIENRLSSSKDVLELAGFKIKGFVTPDSTMADVFKPILRKYYQWADTVYFGAYNGTGKPYMDACDGVYNIYRVSLQSTALANAKAVVDLAIANYGIVTFYGHAATLDTDNNLTTANLTELLTYIQAKVEAGKCLIGNPSDVIQNFFEVRNDDIVPDWVEVTPTEAELDSRFTATYWNMEYSPRMKLFNLSIRLKATEDVSGALQYLAKLPIKPVGVPIVATDSNRACILYDGYIYLQGSGTWATNTQIRFNVMCKIQ